MLDIEKLKRLREGDKCCINFSEGSGGLVSLEGGYYELDYIYSCGRVESVGLFGKKDFEEMIEVATNWE